MAVVYSSVPTHQHVSELAYLLWCEAGSPAGRDREFWFEAERRLLAATLPVAVPATPAAAPSEASKAVVLGAPSAARKKQPLARDVDGLNARVEKELLSDDEPGGRSATSLDPVSDP